MTLIALAAEFAQSDAAGVLADAIPEISNGGSPCRSYAECVADLLATDLVIDYNGPSGLIEIGAIDRRHDPRPIRCVLHRRVGNDSFARFFMIPT